MEIMKATTSDCMLNINSLYRMLQSVQGQTMTCADAADDAILMAKDLNVLSTF